jgi:hypothetical protein
MFLCFWFYFSYLISKHSLQQEIGNTSKEIAFLDYSALPWVLPISQTKDLT